MADGSFPLNRRELVAGLGAAILGPAMPSGALAAGRTAVALQAKPGVIDLRAGAPETRGLAARLIGNRTCFALQAR